MPAGIGAAPLLKTVTTTGAAAPGKAAFGMFGSMYGSWKKPFVMTVWIWLLKPCMML